MARLVMRENALNGGFPEPPSTAPVRVVAAHHDACGADTRVRLPGSVPARAVRRFHCAGCAAAFTARHVEEIELRLAESAPVIDAPPAVEATPVVEAPPVVAAAPIVEAAAIVEAAPVVEAKPRPRTGKPARPKPAAKAKPKPKPKRAKKPKLAARKPKPVRAQKPKPAPKPKRERPKLTMPKWATREISMPKLSMPKLSMPKLAGASAPKPSKPMVKNPSISLPKFDPQNPAWRMASIIVAGLAVLVVLLLLRGGDEPQPGALPAAPSAAGVGDAKGGDGKAKRDEAAKPSKGTKLVRESSFSLALPAGWEGVDPPAGATFAAVAAAGGADATLWITQDPKLAFPVFVSQSLEQLKTLAGSAQVIERTPAPTAEGTVVRLAADAPAGQPSYEVTLRVAGPYRYYLATTVQPDASPEVVDGVDLITGSFTPELDG